MTDRERLLKTRDVLRQFRKDYGKCCNLLAARTLEGDRLRKALIAARNALEKAQHGTSLDLRFEIASANAALG